MLNCAINSTNNSTGPLTPKEFSFSIICELVKITRPGNTSSPNYMAISSWNNWKAENL